MQEYTISLPDELAERLRRYADQRRQRPEDVISELVAQDVPAETSPVPTPVNSAQPVNDFSSVPVGVNPLEKYMGRWEATRFADLTDDEVIAWEAAGEHGD